MKSLVSITLISIAVFTGCKKGAEDPLLSLRTRKNRICKPWVLHQAERNEIQTVRNGSIITSLITNTKSTSDSIKIKTTYYGETQTLRYGSTLDYHFFKDGSFISSNLIHKVSRDTMVIGIDPKTFEVYKYAVSYDSSITESGYGSWEFTGSKNDDVAKNEKLFMSTQRQTVEIVAVTIYNALNGGPGISETKKISQSETRNSVGMAEVWLIRGLSNDRLCLTRTLDESYSKWNGSAFPNAEKTTGEERLELKEKR